MSHLKPERQAKLSPRLDHDVQISNTKLDNFVGTYNSPELCNSRGYSCYSCTNHFVGYTNKRQTHDDIQNILRTLTSTKLTAVWLAWFLWWGWLPYCCRRRLQARIIAVPCVITWQWRIRRWQLMSHILRPQRPERCLPIIFLCWFFHYNSCLFISAPHHILRNEVHRTQTGKPREAKILL